MKTLILKVLILGGTNFLGPHLVQEFQDRGHEVTIFHRGIQNLPSSSSVEVLHGNREGDLTALNDRFWDAIIDTSGHLPRLVENSSKVLSTATNHYTFISTIGVYKDFHVSNIDETYPLAELDDNSTEEINEKTYGALKALCEKMIEQYFKDHFLVIRAGVIVGPRDPTNRFAYWPLRILEGGEILAPGSPKQNLQFIDVRDLAKWIVRMVEKQEIGFYNATGPMLSLNFEEFLKTCAQLSKKEASFSWVSENFLVEHDVQDWSELPLWLSYRRNMPGFFTVSIKKALETNLTFRPLTETIEAIIDWEKQRKQSEPLGLTPIKEQDVLSLWKEQNFSSNGS